jgi:hypothetical protein
MSRQPMTGVLYGVNWERHAWGVYCYASGGNMYLLERKYASNGSDRLSVRECVRAFRADVLGVTR